MELLILVFFALVGVVLLKVFMGSGSEGYMPPPPMYMGPPPGAGQQQYNPYDTGRSPYPPMHGYYGAQVAPVRKRVPKKKIIIISEASHKKRTRKRKI